MGLLFFKMVIILIVFVSGYCNSLPSHSCFCISAVDTSHFFKSLIVNFFL